MTTEIHEGAVVKVLVCQDTDSEIITVNHQPLLTRSFHWSPTYRERHPARVGGGRERRRRCVFRERLRGVQGGWHETGSDKKYS